VGNTERVFPGGDRHERRGERGDSVRQDRAGFEGDRRVGSFDEEERMQRHQERF